MIVAKKEKQQKGKDEEILFGKHHSCRAGRASGADFLGRQEEL